MQYILAPQVLGLNRNLHSAYCTVCFVVSSVLWWKKGPSIAPWGAGPRGGRQPADPHTPNLMCLRYLQPLELSRRDPPGPVVLTSTTLFQVCCPSWQELIPFHTLTRVLLLHSSIARTNWVMMGLECFPSPKRAKQSLLFIATVWNHRHIPPLTVVLAVERLFVCFPT